MATHGPGFEATLWRNPLAQTLRFEVACGLIPVTGLRVADLGCGMGDLAGWLHSSGMQPAAYFGIDALPDMVHAAEARSEVGHEFHVQFAVADITDDVSVLRDWSPDVCVISGSLNTMTQAQAMKVVAEAFDLSKVGVVFNFLSDMPHPRFENQDTSPASRFSTIDFLQWSLKKTPWVQFRQDYIDGHDATIAMKKVNAEEAC